MAKDDEFDKEFLEYIIKGIVDKPDAVEVKRSIDEMGVLLELKVDPEDMGKIIGKEGQTAKAIRILLRILGAKNDARVNMKIIEPEGSDRGPGGPRREEAPKRAPKAPEASEEKDEDLDVDVKL
ncbi:KH domain-containing protein [Patescibacteria group bacterium]